MEKIGLFILAGLALGASLGIFIGAAIGHTALGIGFGAVGGLFIGWFVAAAVIENSKRKNKASDQ